MEESNKEIEILRDRAIRRLNILCLKYESNKITDIEFYGSCVDIYKKLQEDDILLEMKDTNSIKHCMYIRNNLTQEIEEKSNPVDIEKNEKMHEIVKIDRRDTGIDSLLDI